MASRNFYKKLLAIDVRKAQEAMSSQYKAEAGKASKQAGRGKIGGTIGGLIGQFGVPALLGAIGVSTGGVGLLALSALGATLGSYAGNKAGQGMGARANVDAIKRQKFGSDEYNTYQGEIDSQLDQIEDAARADALRTGAAVGAQGITMGVDKYATYAKNPLGHYFKGFRNPQQHADAIEKATKGLTKGTDAYNAALKKAGYNFKVLPEMKQIPETLNFNPTGVVDSYLTAGGGSAAGQNIMHSGMPRLAREPISLLNTTATTVSNTPMPVASYASIPSGPAASVQLSNAQSIGGVVPGDPLYKNLLQAVTNPFTQKHYITPGIHGRGVVK